jgi:agmatinase
MSDTIRRAAPEDRQAVEAIVNAAYEGYIPRIGKPPGPMLDDYAALITDGSVFVLDAADGVAGILVLLEAADHLLLDNVAVAPARKGGGFGRRLIAFAESEARRRGYGEIRLYTHVTMVENVALYLRLGYEETGRGEQAGYQRVFMRKTLGEPARGTLTFAGFPGCAGPGAASAPIAVLGAEHGTPYRKGEPSHTAGAPAAIRAAIKGYGASRGQHDFDLDAIPPDCVVDCGDVAGDPADPAGNRARITAAVRTLIDKGVVPIVLGGDDSVPIPVFEAFAEKGPLTILQIDAHIDWRDEVTGERFGYSSTMRRASEMRWIERIVQVGARGIGSARQADVEAARGWGAHLVRAIEVHRHGVAPVLDLVPAGARCLVTIDCDGLDPSIMPGVMAPAPGGLLYWHALELLHGIAAKARIVGFDIVEFVPGRDPLGDAALTAARIVANAIAAITRSNGG